eukprot:TRINITY_DN45420_c0_g1_i1.p1 TRINITY_DN45420_c0_g1~~TRINITY_DN45420_c0_g1_i1.p1  ORF type:complete len:516 (-),score=56.48 TRINITY_DN45420_c0_g1_i1:27-1574(-)
MLEELFMLLQRLPSTSRRKIFEDEFTHPQRLAFEAWFHSGKSKMFHRTSAGTSSGNNHAIVAQCDRQCPSEGHESDFDSSGTDASDTSSESEFLELCDVDKDPNGSAVGISEGTCPDYIASELSGQTSRSDKIPEHAASETQHTETDVIADDPGETPIVNEPSSHLGGIGRKETAHGTLYYARIYIEAIVVRSRMTPLLDLALDHLTILTTAKQDIIAAGDQPFEDRFRSVFSNGFALATLSLSFNVRVKLKWWWIGNLVGTQVFHDVEHLLQAWKVMHRYSSHCRGRITTSDRLLRLRTFPQEWPAYLKEYCGVIQDLGFDSAAWLARMEALEKSSVSLRERYAMSVEEQLKTKRGWKLVSDEELKARAQQRFESWNLRRMAREERFQRRLVREASRREQRNRAAMSREDRSSRIWREHATLESALRARILQLLERWRSLLQRRHRAALLAKARLARKRAARLRAARNKHREDLMLKAKREREQRQERELRWKWYKRSDLTMEDLLNVRESSGL